MTTLRRLWDKHCFAISSIWTMACMLAMLGCFAWYKHSTAKALGDGVRACRCVCEAP